MARTANNTEKEELISKAEIKKSQAKKIQPPKVTPTRRSSVRIATKLSLKSDVSKARKKGKVPLKKRPDKLTVAPSPCSDASTPGLSAASTLHGLKHDEDKTNIKDEPMKGTDEEAVVEDAHTLKGDRANVQAKAKEGIGATIDSNLVQEAVPVNDSFWEVPATIAVDDPPQPSTPPTMPLEFTSSCFSGPFIQGDIEQFQKRTGENFASKQLFDGNEGDTPLPFDTSPDLFSI